MIIGIVTQLTGETFLHTKTAIQDLNRGDEFCSDLSINGVEDNSRILTLTADFEDREAAENFRNKVEEIPTVAAAEITEASNLKSWE